MIYNTQTRDKPVGSAGRDIKDEDIKKSLESMKSSLSTIKTQLQNDSVQKMEDQLEDHINMIVYVKPSIKGLNSKMEQLTKDLEQSRKSLLDMQTQHAQLNEKYLETQVRLDTLKEENNRLTAHTHNLNNDYKELSQHAITALSSPTSNQDTNLQDYASMYHQLQATTEQYSKLKDQYAKLKESGGSNEDADSLRGKIMELEDKLQSQQQDHEMELEQMQKTWSKLKDTIRNRSTTQVGLPEHLSPMTPENRSGGASKSELFAAKAEVELLKDRLRDMESQASKSQASWETAKSSYDLQIKNMEEDHKEEVLILEKENSSISTELKRLKTRYLDEKNKWEDSMDQQVITIDQHVQCIIPTKQEIDAEAKLQSLNDVISSRESQLNELELNVSKREEILQAQQLAMKNREDIIVEAEVLKTQLDQREIQLKKSEKNLLEKEAKLKEERLDAIKNEMYQYEQEIRSSHEKKLNAIFKRENDLIEQKESLVRQRKELEREIAAHGQIHDREGKLKADIEELRSQIAVVEKEKLKVIEHEQDLAGKEAQIAQLELQLNMREQNILRQEQKKQNRKHITIQTDTSIPASDPYQIMEASPKKKEEELSKKETPEVKKSQETESPKKKNTKIFYQPDYIIRKLNQNNRENKLVDQIKQLKRRIRGLNEELSNKHLENEDMIQQMKATGYWNTFVESMENAEDYDHRSYIMNSPTTKKPLSFLEGYEQHVNSTVLDHRTASPNIRKSPSTPRSPSSPTRKKQ
eukprot:CAMPEP_0117425310 /NCGR_PEP_ID=MMETSP0758-20121206/5596_1 /TAXON_ID=63605 /ORGANISM="Percolomonas cosmopolitus, Strain AE-1 (ATCC 50343)" /LENGTH=753 /DNA_ID=CAMNT_0005209695 /DNA_START=269 /DNA_END=2527 /DNA_ORIENTATION=-